MGPGNPKPNGASLRSLNSPTLNQFKKLFASQVESLSGLVHLALQLRTHLLPQLFDDLVLARHYRRQALHGILQFSNLRARERLKVPRCLSLNKYLHIVHCLSITFF